ncbi:MAG TPA: DNA-directed RNA polymerase subunit P [Candidatus Nanoarchaeia archaeon]|nr:DNA-directed RNA polymerase subunit P [Candidatus Nanoarchaeia archaeon]
MEYICFKCEKKVELEKGGRIRCPYCGGKVLYKKKPDVIVPVNVK